MIRRADPLAWAIGALVAAGMFVGRTTGLPRFYEAEWDPLLLASLVLEVVHLALYVATGLSKRSTE